MSTFTNREVFSKSEYSLPYVQAEERMRLEIPNCISSTITSSKKDWILISKYGTTSDASSSISEKNTPVSSSIADTKSLKTAIMLNEIGNASPYKLSFAINGRSGASFGFMQGDMATGPSIVHNTFYDALSSCGVSVATIGTLSKRLSVPLSENPLTPQETNMVNSSFNSTSGRPCVDSMDNFLFSHVLDDLKRCINVSITDSRRISVKAQLCIAMWINMSGHPTTIITWLSGNSVDMAKIVPAPGAVVNSDSIENYLSATKYFSEYPDSLTRFMQCASDGMNVSSVA